MSKVLAVALDTIRRERVGGFSEAFSRVDAVRAEFGEENLANRLMQAIPADVADEVVADLFGILEWSTADNGSALRRDTDRWLLSNVDDRRIYVALHMEAFPLPDIREMEGVLTRLAEARPMFRSRCKELIAMRRQVED